MVSSVASSTELRLASLSEVVFVWSATICLLQRKPRPINITASNYNKFDADDRRKVVLIEVNG